MRLVRLLARTLQLRMTLLRAHALCFSYTIKKPRDFLVKCLPALRAAIYMLKLASVVSKPLFDVSLPSLSASFLHGLEHDHACVAPPLCPIPPVSLLLQLTRSRLRVFACAVHWTTWAGCTRRSTLRLSTYLPTARFRRMGQHRQRRR